MFQEHEKLSILLKHYVSKQQSEGLFLDERQIKELIKERNNPATIEARDP